MVRRRGRPVHAEYDASGNPKTSPRSTPAASGTEFIYDARNLPPVADRGGRYARCGYRHVHLRPDEPPAISATDFRGSFYITTYVYDGLGQRLEMDQQIGTPADPLVAVTTWEYDAVGNAVAQTDPLGRTFTYVYDARNLLVEVDQPEGPVSAPAVARTTNVFNDAGQLVQTTDPLGYVTQYTYDAVGRSTSQTIVGAPSPDNPSGLITTTWDYVYTAGLLRVIETDPDGVVSTTFY